MTLPEQLQSVVDAWVRSGGQAELETPIQAILDMPEYKTLPYLVRNRPFLTSSKIKAFKECAYHAKLKFIDEIDMGFDDPEYFAIGSAVDTWVTNGEQSYRDNYLVGSKVTKDFKALIAENPTKPTLTPANGQLVERAAREYLTREFFPKLPAKRNVLWIMNGLACKAELDHFDSQTRRIGDIKTCASITTFEPDSYKQQMAFYAFGIEKKWGEKVEAEIYAVDKHSGWSRSHKWVFSHQTLQSHYYEIENLVQQYRDSLDSGIWAHCDTRSEECKKICWSSEYWQICTICRQMESSIL